MNEVRRVYQYEMTRKIAEVSSHGSSLKQEIFKSAIMGKDIDKTKVRSFLTFTNDFLKFWEDYGNHLSELMMKSHGKEGVRTWAYQNIKDFIYEKYDFASVIKFMNSIHGLVGEGNNNVSVEDVSDMYRDTITTAFDDMPDTVAGLLDTFLNDTNELYVVRADKTEAKMYDTVKSYRKTFDSTSRSVLYRSITKAVELLCDPKSVSYIKSDNMKIFVSIINNIVEYMVYSISFYAIRIYLIGAYAYPYIESNRSEAISESVEEHKDLPVANSMDFSSMTIDIMKNSDELKCRDYKYIKVNIDTFNAFVEAIGAFTLLNGEKLEYGRWISLSEVNEKNMFGSKLIHNPLYMAIVDKLVSDVDFNRKSLEETNQILRSSIINNQHGLEGATTDKHEILHVINGVGDISTVKGCQSTAADLTKFNFIILSNIEKAIKFMQSMETKEGYNNIIFGISDKKIAKECAKMLEDLYKDISIATLQRARAIEMRYNSLVSDKSKDVTKLFSLDIRPKTTSDAIPDTTRMPYDLMDLYTLPAFESMEMYDEYLRSLPMFESDMYFSEAFNFSSIINAVKSAMAAMWKRLMTFVNNQRVKAAVKWVTDNETKLRSMDIEGSLKMKVHPYPETRNDKNGIDIMKGIKNLRDNISTINPEDQNLKVDEFITSLYPSPAVQKWWDDDPKKGNQMYHNYIVFGIAENQVKPDIMQEVEITTNNIKDIVLGFIESVKSLDKTYKSLEQIKKDIDTGIDKIQKATVKATNTEQQNKSNDSVGAAEGNNNDQKNNQNNQNNNQQNSDADKLNPSGTDKMQLLANGTKLAIDRLWVPIAGMIVNSIVDQYKVIQKIYNTANSGAANNQTK